jgi:hypothetical protein
MLWLGELARLCGEHALHLAILVWTGLRRLTTHVLHRPAPAAAPRPIASFRSPASHKDVRAASDGPAHPQRSLSSANASAVFGCVIARIGPRVMRPTMASGGATRRMSGLLQG